MLTTQYIAILTDKKSLLFLEESEAIRTWVTHDYITKNGLVCSCSTIIIRQLKRSTCFRCWSSVKIV